MTKKELVRAVAAETNCTIKDITRIVEVLQEKAVKAIAEEGELNIKDFGKFVVKEVPARIYSNPRTGEAIPVAASKKPAFRPAAALKKAVQ